MMFTHSDIEAQWVAFVYDELDESARVAFEARIHWTRERNPSGPSVRSSSCACALADPPARDTRIAARPDCPSDPSHSAPTSRFVP